MNTSTNVEYRGLDIEVQFYYEAGQKEIIKADPNECQEGFAPYVEVNKVLLGKEDITALFDEDMAEELADLILEQAK